MIGVGYQIQANYRDESYFFYKNLHSFLQGDRSVELMKSIRDYYENLPQKGSLKNYVFVAVNECIKILKDIEHAERLKAKYVTDRPKRETL